MGLAWQQAPFGEWPKGRFLSPDPVPQRVLYAEPAERRMRVELGGAVVATSDQVTLLHETGRYPVAYFPPDDVAGALLRRSNKQAEHAQLGQAQWWSIEVDGELFHDVAWTYQHPPAYARSLRGLIAFVWEAMDAFYEEDEVIHGHAADPYHRVDVRSTRRAIAVTLDGRPVADTRSALAVFETGFAPRWYIPRRDVVPGTLEATSERTFCPYKGVAHYFDVVVVDGARAAAGAWSYPEALPESARLENDVSFDLEQLTVTIDGARLASPRHQSVVPTGDDRALGAPDDPAKPASSRGDS